MFRFVAGNETAGGVDDAPPGQRAVGTGKERSDRPGRARKASLQRDLAVGHDDPGGDGQNHGLYRGGELIRRARGQG